MKNVIFTLIALTFILSAKAQKIVISSPTAIAVEHIPEFPGGMKAFYDFLSSNTHYPALSRQKSIQGRVLITMVIEKDGSLSNIKIVKGVATDIDNEALRVMALSPHWNPGTQNGKPVRVAYAIPISFTLTKN